MYTRDYINIICAVYVDNTRRTDARNTNAKWVLFYVYFFFILLLFIIIIIIIEHGLRVVHTRRLCDENRAARGSGSHDE